MPQKKLPRSVRKFLRRKKAEIRRQFLSSEEAEGKIEELVKQIYKQYPGSRKQNNSDTNIRMAYE